MSEREAGRVWVRTLKDSWAIAAVLVCIGAFSVGSWEWHIHGHDFYAGIWAALAYDCAFGVCKAFYDAQKQMGAERSVREVRITPEWCMEEFYRVNPGAHTTMGNVPSLYLLDFARAVVSRIAAAAHPEGGE